MIACIGPISLDVYIIATVVRILSIAIIRTIRLRCINIKVGIWRILEHIPWVPRLLIHVVKLRSIVAKIIVAIDRIGVIGNNMSLVRIIARIWKWAISILANHLTTRITLNAV